MGRIRSACTVCPPHPVEASPIDGLHDPGHRRKGLVRAALSRGAVVALILLAVAPVAVAQNAVRVTAAEAEVRLRPDSTSALVAVLGLGTLLDVRSREGDWYGVELPEDDQRLRRYGYISVRVVQPVGSVQSGALASGTEQGTGVTTHAGPAERVFVLDAHLKSVGAVNPATGSVKRVSYARGVPPGVPSLWRLMRSGLTPDEPAEIVLTPEGSGIVVIDHGPGKMNSRFGWRPSRRSSLTLIDAASLQPIASAEGVWGRPTLHHIANDGSRLTIVGPGYRSKHREETRPPEIVNVDLRTGATIARFDLSLMVGSSHSSVEWAATSALSPDGQYLYLLDRGKPSTNPNKHINGRIVVVSTTTGEERAALGAGSEPRGLIVDKDEGQVVVLSDHPPYVKAPEQRYGELRIIRGDRIATTVSVGSDPQFLRVSQDGAYFYVFSSQGLTRVDRLALQPAGQMRVDRAGITGWVAGEGDTPQTRLVARVGQDWVDMTWRVPERGDSGTVSDASISPDGRRAYVLHAGSSQLSVLDLETQSRIATVTTGRRSAKVKRFLSAAVGTALSYASARYQAEMRGQPFFFYRVYSALPAQTELAVRPDGKFVYILNSQTKDVTVVDAASARVVRHLPVAGTYLQVLPESDLLCVGDSAAMSFVDMRTHTEVKELKLMGPNAAATLAPDGARLWLLSMGGVSSIDTRTGRLVASFGEVGFATQILFDVSSARPALVADPGARLDSPVPELKLDTPRREQDPISPAILMGFSAPGALRWSVGHLHRGFSGCGGTLYVQDGHLGFRSTPDEPHSWEVALESVKEIKANRMGSFHITLVDGQNYNFFSVLGDRLVLTLQEEVAKAKSAKRPQ